MALVETKESNQSLAPRGIANIISEKFSGHKIRVDSETGYICGSDICKAGGKLLGHYKANKDAKAFIEYLSSVIGIPISKLMIIIKGGSPKKQGTWVHKRIALDLARWISPEIACFIYDIVERFASGDLSMAKEVLENHDRLNDSNTTFTSRASPSTGERIAIAETTSNEEFRNNPRKKAREELKFKRLEHKYAKLQIEHNGVKLLLEEATTGFFEVSNERDTLLARINEIAKETKEREEKIAEEHRRQLSRIEGYAEYSANKAKKFDKKLDEVLPAKVDTKKLPKGKRPQLRIMRDKDAEEGELDLYVIRAQERRMKKTIKDLKKDYGENIITSFKTDQPNSIAFWETIWQECSKNIIKDSKSNWFRLDGITRRQFYQKIQNVDKLRTSKD